MRYNSLHNESKVYYMATSPPPPLIQNNDIVGNYKLIKTIGRGVSGKVKLGVHIQTGEEVAIKIISRQQINKSPLISKAIERELGILQLVYHPHLVELKQVLQDSNNVYFIMENMSGGELFHYITEHGRLNEYDAKAFFTQIISGLSWCHNHHICHRDLKLENILLDKTKQVIKIADFGMATIQPSSNLLRTSCGSPHYASPEIIKGNPYYGPAADIWSCGIILYILLCGYHPFDDKRTPHLLYKIKNGRYKPILDDVSSLAKDLITNMLMVDPNKRFNIHDVLNHAWLLPQLKPNPWYQYDQLIPPLVNDSCIIEGWIWETLKILWRDSRPDRILSALASNKPNIQKLTYILLLQRNHRLIASLSSIQSSHIPNDDNSNTNNTSNNNSNYNSNYNNNNNKQINTTESYLSLGTINTSPPPTLCEDNNLITSPSSSISSYQSDHIPTNTTTTHSSTLFNIPSTFQNDLPIHYTKEKQSYFLFGNIYSKVSKQQQQKKRHWYPFYYNQHLNQLYQHKVWKAYHSKPFTSQKLIHHVYNGHHSSSSSSSSSMSSLLVLLNSTSLKSSTSIKTATKPSSIASTSSSLPTISTTSSFSSSSFISSFTVFNKTIKLCKKAYHHTHSFVQDIIKKKDTPSKIFSIGCSAKHVNEAAGKLHHVLQENFNGYLHQRGYISGQLFWTGSIQLSEEKQKLSFICYMPNILSARRIGVSFILTRGNATEMKTAMDQLLQILNDYERQAKVIMDINGWN